jgi:hypothetical protein
MALLPPNDRAVEQLAEANYFTVNNINQNKLMKA